MTSTAADTEQRDAGGWAARVTDALEPKNWILAVTLLIGWHAGRVGGVAWGLCAGVFSAVIPILWITWGERRGYWGDRHVRRRQDRLIVIPGIMLSVATGLTLMRVFDAPREVLALVVAMLVCLVVFLGVTAFWKISFHTAVSSGAVTMLILAYGPWACALWPLVVLVGWSRVVLRDHTPAQTVVGAVAGAVIAGPVFDALS
ncbi:MULTISPECIES: phosphatase PAP2 family protein [unclassified Streptomyces]|uniref:phosphatase PAP2 family protein n=1 Tax=unclassified Streptomyces TaxID=2593676 RepID=UPI0038074416